MDQGSSPYIQMIQECEAVIVRIRAAIRAGTATSEEVGNDFAFIQSSITPRLVGYARKAAWMSPLAMEEALEAMHDRLFQDIWSLSFVSLETQFGAYLRSMPIRVLQQMSRKHVAPDVSLPVERLDEPLGEDGMPLHEAVGDPHATRAFDEIGEREALNEAIAQLPPDERHVIMLRLQDIENSEIARRLGVSAPTATRIYQRAVTNLKRRLTPEEE
jgi:RNA polymerase sigma factor (sigma-70 family)